MRRRAALGRLFIAVCKTERWRYPTRRRLVRARGGAARDEGRGVRGTRGVGEDARGQCRCLWTTRLPTARRAARPIGQGRWAEDKARAHGAARGSLLPYSLTLLFRRKWQARVANPQGRKVRLSEPRAASRTQAARPARACVHGRNQRLSPVCGRRHQPTDRAPQYPRPPHQTPAPVAFCCDRLKSGMFQIQQSFSQNTRMAALSMLEPALTTASPT